jgi:hypothetical protein
MPFFEHSWRSRNHYSVPRVRVEWKGVWGSLASSLFQKATPVRTSCEETRTFTLYIYRHGSS